MLNEKLKIQVTEKDTSLCALQRTVASLEAKVARSSVDRVDAVPLSAPRSMAMNPVFTKKGHIDIFLI